MNDLSFNPFVQVLVSNDKRQCSIITGYEVCFNPFVQVLVSIFNLFLVNIPPDAKLF